MNYFAHGRHFVDDPYCLAGTAVPDWLNVVDRRMRVRKNVATTFVRHQDESLAAVARGIVRHHQDDAWFHATRAFAELSWQFTATIRNILDPDIGLRPSFLGHILVELLLDATLIAEHPASLDAYYRALDGVDPHVVAGSVNRMATRANDSLAAWIPRFSRERFLYDYLDDAKLLFRLNQVLQRVKLAVLPEGFREILPEARASVQRRKDDLLLQPAPPHEL